MPKKKSSELYDLVHSLSKNEAGYFKKFSARHSATEDLDYIQLFNLLSRQKKHDDGAILKQYKFRNYSRLKNYLHQSILQALYSYHSNTNSSALLRKYINDIELLYGKALYKQCKKLLKKAKRTAVKYEKFNAIIDLINWEIKIMQSNTELEALQKSSSRFLKENHEAFERMQNITQYTILYSRIFSLARTLGPARSPEGKKLYDKIIQDPLLRDEKRALSAYARMIYYHIHAVYTFACHLPARENHFSRLLIEHIEHTPTLLEEEKERYLISLNNLISSSVRMRNFEEATRCISKLRSLPVSTPNQPDYNNLAHRVFARSFIQELFLYCRKGEPDKALAVINTHGLRLKKLRSRINIANLTELFYRIAYSYFMAGESKKALEWTNKVVTDKAMNPINEFYSYSLLLNIAIHIELKNYDYASYIVKNTFEALKKKGGLNAFESAVVKCFMAISASEGKEEQIILKKYKKHEDTLRSLANNPYENFVLYQFDILAWLQSKIEKRPFSEMIRSSNQQK